MDKKTVLGNNDIDDVRWLCSLTASELDLLMGLKHMVNTRAQMIGHENLAKKFDLKMLRKLSFMHMEHLKGRLKHVQELSAFDCNLLKQNVREPFCSMTVEELYPYLCSDQNKRIAEMFSEDMPPSQRKKSTTDPVNDDVAVGSRDLASEPSSNPLAKRLA